MKPGRQRLDKWLWFARFARTRSLAARLVAEGYVRVNGRRADAAATAIGIGDVVTVAAAHTTAILRVLDLGERRGAAPEAQRLYASLGGTDGAASD
ncbi:RNA-binding S4 domain-containing protein [Methylobacterium sp. BTF04]|uniref:RNA-binding S4 domain-containing protein n=1 Tax=Methylobacterium sp. BTF04 TaxID=2708300 RepID=UPI0013CFF64D|nr:RNA-binding S4 domain-containing protein [Methylobacterium sp. BTF04]NEU12359.1 RNA-binding S4 domain-containing protein [Methylobacterium sp. BTF04]